MLRNTFVLAAHTLARPQNIRKCNESALKRFINVSPVITESTSVYTTYHMKSFSTNVPKLQKDEYVLINRFVVMILSINEPNE